MKKLIYLFSVLLCVATVVGCSDWGEEPALNLLELESANVSFDAYGGSGDIVVKTTGGVTAASAATWCTTAVSGNKITVTVSVNGELLGRSTVVTVTSDAKTVQVPVTQSGVQIELSHTPITMPNTASDTTLRVRAPMPLTVTSSATWLVPSITDSVLTIHAEASLSLIVREATVSVTAGSFTKSIVVAQLPSKASFNSYLGAWTFTHTTGVSTIGVKYHKTATVAAAGRDSLRVTLQAGATASTTFTFLMTYDPATGAVYVPAQKVFQRDGKDVFLYRSNGTTGIDFEGRMTGIPTGGTVAKPVLTFKDVEGSTYVGFILVSKNNDAYYIYTGFGTSDQNNRFTNIIMTKK
jgi:hypothetical protein